MAFLNPPAASAEGDIWFSFLSIVLEGAPYLFFGTLISGFIDAFLPGQAMERLLPQRLLPGIMAAGLLEMVFPVCECAVVPVIRRLLQKGLPLSHALTYMLAAPVINPITALSTMAAFKGQDAMMMTFSRFVMAWLVTVVAGLLVSRISASQVLLERVLVASTGGHHHAQGEVRARCGRALGTAMYDFLDTGKYLVFGVFLTALFNTQVVVRPGLQDGIAALAGNDVFAVPAMMTLAFVLSLCSTTDAFIAVNMQGFSAASKLAFLVFSPVVDLKLLFMYASVFRKPFIIWLVCGLFVAVGLCALVWKTLFMA